MALIDEKVKNPFLTLISERVNGSIMSICPEFDVSASGYDSRDVLDDLCNMIELRSSNILANHKDGKETPVHLLKYSQKIIEAKNAGQLISALFKK